MKSYKGKVQSIFYLSLISLLLYGCNNSDNNKEDISKKLECVIVLN